VNHTKKPVQGLSGRRGALTVPPARVVPGRLALPVPPEGPTMGALRPFRRCAVSQGPTPPGGNPFDPSGPPPPPPDAQRQQARERVQLPALFLIVVGLLNVLAAGYLLLNGVVIGGLPPDKFKELMEQRNPGALGQLEQAGYSVEWFQTVTKNVS